MSHIFNYDAANAASIYDRERCPMGADVIAGLLQVYCSKSLKNIHILDAGCGTGQYTDALIKLGLGKVTLQDASAKMLEVAKAKLQAAISSKVIDTVVLNNLPALPFEDGTFDAVMFNLVLHHLDRETHDRKFPMLEKCLSEAKRVLRPDGVLIISTALPLIIEKGYWFTQISQDYKDRILGFSLTTEEFLAVFRRNKFQCVSAMNLLRVKDSTIFKHYLDCEGPFKSDWRIGTSMFHYGDELMNNVDDCFNKEKESGRLKQFMNDSDRTGDIGALTLFVCVSESSKFGALPSMRRE